jgi:hypothetical protein
MSESDPLENPENAERHVPEPIAATCTARKGSLGLDWNRLILHPRLERIVRRLFPDQRRYARLVVPNVVAYLGRAHATRPYRIADISVGGFCMQSDQSWTVGTEIPITLQREDWDGDESSQSVTVQAMVVRCGQQEIGFSIALLENETIAPTDPFDECLRVEKKAMEEFLADLQKPKPPRCLPAPFPNQRPMLLSERTKLLLEIAGSHRLSATSELWYSKINNASRR